jgi:hypothetical protein
VPSRAGFAAALVAGLVLLGALAPRGARAQGALGERVSAAEQGVASLAGAAKDRLDAVPVLGELTRRLHVSGSWLGTTFAAASGSPVPDGGFATWDARLFADLELVRDWKVGTRPLVDAVGVTFEWEFVRLGQRMDEFGELYLDLQGLGGSSWLNVQLGRFQIPVGENYLRFGKAVRDNPFISNTVAGAWWWDEGVRIHGSRPDGRFGYVASWSSGETDRDFSLDGGGQATLKLFGQVTPWLRLSASALWSGSLGSDADPASAALWLGEAWARGFGSGSPVPNLATGRPVPDGPGRLERTVFLGVDAILTHPRGARLWLSYGRYEIDSGGASFYDRELHAWIVEAVLEGRLLLPELTPFYAALRANGLGTYEGERGYLLDVRYTVPYGYNMRSLTAVSAALGWRIGRHASFKVEYTFQDVDLVQGAGRSGLSARNASYFGAALGVHF